MELGFAYLYGNGVIQYPTLAFRYFNQALQNPTSSTYVEIGSTYEKTNPEVAMEYYNTSIKLGYPMGYGALGNMYLNGSGAEKDIPKALSYYQKGASAGDTMSMINLSYLYSTTLIGEPNKSEQLKWLEKAAALNDGDANRRLGILYDNGDGVPVDKELARKYYKKSILLDHLGATECMMRIAKTYTNFHSDKEEGLLSLDWYMRAANLGNPIAMLTVGVYYEEGYGVELDWDEAMIWFKKAYETKDPATRQFLKDKGIEFK